MFFDASENQTHPLPEFVDHKLTTYSPMKFFQGSGATAPGRSGTRSLARQGTTRDTLARQDTLGSSKPSPGDDKRWVRSAPKEAPPSGLSEAAAQTLGQFFGVAVLFRLESQFF